MIPTECFKDSVSTWFTTLQNDIIQALEHIELDVNSQAKFEKKSWTRSDPTQVDHHGGGGTMAVLRGDVFEKAGVNVSTVFGQFSAQFASQIPGCQNDPSFWASGISLVIHPKNPYVPITHMNTRMICTQKTWFGGGGDLTPVIPFEDDTKDFHQALKNVCDTYDTSYYPEFSKWCDTYFYIKHRQETRGVGGIFYDYQYADSEQKREQLFAFTQDVGTAFKTIYTQIVRRHMHTPYGAAEQAKQSHKRSRYVEFNLLYDRGTKFGLETGGNVEAILMSMPPEAKWP
ncbi:MAG: oxygen-dependent coproporphyrinogen oxidase [Alphaproteobacteria bacterium]|nr:oxygen-dependent coproporphyrinogen oxidase [Alphaproteobacteria bacterium]